MMLVLQQNEGPNKLSAITAHPILARSFSFASFCFHLLKPKSSAVGWAVHLSLGSFFCTPGPGYRSILFVAPPTSLLKS